MNAVKQNKQSASWVWLLAKKQSFIIGKLWSPRVTLPQMNCQSQKQDTLWLLMKENVSECFVTRRKKLLLLLGTSPSHIDLLNLPTFHPIFFHHRTLRMTPFRTMLSRLAHQWHIWWCFVEAIAVTYGDPYCPEMLEFTIFQSYATLLLNVFGAGLSTR